LKSVLDKSLGAAHGAATVDERALRVHLQEHFGVSPMPLYGSPRNLSTS